VHGQLQLARGGCAAGRLLRSRVSTCAPLPGAPALEVSAPPLPLAHSRDCTPIPAPLIPGLPTPQADVVNRGFSGYNSRWGVYLLDEVLGAFNARIDFATVCFGANDAAGAETSV
jgi:lysophospholipase L1-like esterase